MKTNKEIKVYLIGRGYDEYDLNEKEEIAVIDTTEYTKEDAEKVAFVKASDCFYNGGLAEIYNEIDETRTYVHEDGMTGQIKILHSVKELRKHLAKYEMNLIVSKD